MSRIRKYQARVRIEDRRYSYGYFETLEESEKAQAKVELRLYREMKKGHIVGSEGEILRTRFKDGETYFSITGTQNTGRGKWEVVDFVKNETTKEIREVSRKKLFNLTRK